MARTPVVIAFGVVAAITFIIVLISFGIGMSLSNDKCQASFYPGDSTYISNEISFCEFSLTYIRHYCLTYFILTLVAIGLSFWFVLRSYRALLGVILAAAIVMFIVFLIWGVFAALSMLLLPATCAQSQRGLSCGIQDSCSGPCYVCTDTSAQSNITCSFAAMVQYSTSTSCINSYSCPASGNYITASANADNISLMKTANAAISVAYVGVFFWLVMSIMSCAICCCNQNAFYSSDPTVVVYATVPGGGVQPAYQPGYQQMPGGYPVSQY